jgi:hypothetical protein
LFDDKERQKAEVSIFKITSFELFSGLQKSAEQVI